MDKIQIRELNRLLLQLQHAWDGGVMKCPACYSHWIKYGHEDFCELKKFIDLTGKLAEEKEEKKEKKCCGKCK